MDTSNLYESWTRICEQIKSYDSMIAPQINAFFARLEPQVMADGFLLVTAESEFIKNEVERRFMALILRALKDLTGVDYLVEIMVDSTPTPVFHPEPTRVTEGDPRSEYGTQPSTAASGSSHPQSTQDAQALRRGDQTMGILPQMGDPAQQTFQDSAAHPQPASPVTTPQTEDTGTGCGTIAGGSVLQQAILGAKSASMASQPRSEGRFDTGTWTEGDPTGESGWTTGAPEYQQEAPGRSNVFGEGFGMAARLAEDAGGAGAEGYTGNQLDRSYYERRDTEADVLIYDDGDQLSSVLTFENFVLGESNRLAYSMAVSVAEEPGRAALNPLFIYGRSGLGKTHLLRSIQNYIRVTRPYMRTVYVDSSELVSEYTAAAMAHDRDKMSYQNFQRRYLEADVLLIDDVQYFQGKDATLDIVFQLFKKLQDSGKQIVLSADRAPKNIDIAERLYSRFGAGGVVDIKPPEIETKLGILRSFINEYRTAENRSDLYIPDDILLYIAQISSSNVRELKSAVTSVIGRIEYFGVQGITLSDVKELLKNHFSSGAMRRLNEGIIQAEVERFYKVSHAEIVGKARTRNIMYARQVAMYLCRQLLDVPYGDIGKKFNRDHSTVIYSVSKVEEQLQTDRNLQEEIEVLVKNIKES